MSDKLLRFAAVPVLQASRGTSQMQSVQPAVVVDDRPVQAIGAVDFRDGFRPGKNGLPQAITLRFDNSGGATPTLFLFGDSFGLIAAKLAPTVPVKPSAPASSIDGIVNAIGSNPRVYKSLNYRIITGNASQFSNRFEFADADEDGSVTYKPFNMGSAQRNTQQNDKILTLAQDIYMDGTCGLLLLVGAGNIVELDLQPGEIYRPGAAI